MAKKRYEEANIAAIAERIRENTGGDKKYKTSEMPSGVDEVYEAGYTKGKSEGGGGVAEPVLQELDVTENGVYLPDPGYDGFDKVTVAVEGGGSGSSNNSELVGAYNSSTFTCMMNFATTPNSQGNTGYIMANKEGWDIGSFYSSQGVQPSDRYRVIFTRIDGYDYWQTFLFSVGDYSTLIEPATNENVLKHITIIDDNTYEVTIPEGCYWFNVNFYSQMPCYIYKLN